MDAKDETILKGMHQFAKNTYMKQRDQIAAFLNLQPVKAKTTHII
jgi:hypothetical protein